MALFAPSRVAARYSPISGLVTDNNYNAYLGSHPSFANPNAPAAPGSPAGAAPAIMGAGAYTPDWKSLIEGDAGLIGSKSALAAGGVASLGDRNAAIQNAYVSFGSNIDIPTLAKQLGMTEADVQAALGPDAQRLAQENTNAGLSTQARLNQANQLAVAKIRAELNRRGLLNSGETGYQLGQQDLGYRQAQSDATQKLLGYLQQYQQGYTAAEQSRQGQLAQAYSDAANRAVATNQSSPGVTATLDHVDPSGAPVYKGPDGQLYTSDGRPYAAAQAPSGFPSGVLNDSAFFDGSEYSGARRLMGADAAPGGGGLAARMT